MPTTDLRQAIGLRQFTTLLIAVGMILTGCLGYINALTSQAVLITALFIAVSILSFYAGQQSQTN